ncbi:MAG: DMT family transporter [Oscillospiraceae bacterium]
MSRNNTRSYIMLVSSMLIFGTIGIFRKFIPLSSGMTAFSRGLLGSAFLVLFLAAKRHRLNPVGIKKLLLLALTGAFLGLNWILLFEAYNYTSVAAATMCYYMQPTIVILLSPFVFRERITVKKLLCAAAAVVGMVFVSGAAEGGGISAQDITGVLFGLGAAVLYSLVVILNKKVRLDDAYEKTVIQLAASALVLLPYLLVTEDLSSVRLDITAVLMLLAVGLIHTGIAYALYFGSMKDLESQSVALLSYIDPVFALILSACVLHERLTVLGAAGAVLIIGSAVVSELTPKKGNG